METAYTIIFFLAGLLFGSFFNVVGMRVPKKEPFANERSACPGCDHTLAWYELLPVVSYIFLRAKCAYCKRRISILYPIIELATAFLFAFSYAKLGLTMELLIALLLVSMLAILFVADIRYMLLPNRILLFFLPLFVLLRYIKPLDPWWDALVGGAAGVVLLSLVILISRGGMGGGDMKLFGLLGIVFGLKKLLLTFFLSTLLGALIGSTLLVSGVIGRKQPVPFGPYIIVAALVAYFYGEVLIGWYLNLFM